MKKHFFYTATCLEVLFGWHIRPVFRWMALWALLFTPWLDLWELIVPQKQAGS